MYRGGTSGPHTRPPPELIVTSPRRLLLVSDLLSGCLFGLLLWDTFWNIGFGFRERVEPDPSSLRGLPFIL